MSTVISLMGNVIAPLSCSILVVSMILTLTKTHSFSTPVRLIILLLAVGICVFPYNGLMFCEYIFSLLGQLSVGTIVICSIFILKQLLNRQLVQKNHTLIFFLVVLVSALFLYPCSLGLCYFDPYNIGYGPFILVIILFSLALLACLYGNFLIVAWITLSMLAFMARVFESTNLWDYLIDPITVVIAMSGSFRFVFFKNK